MSTNISVHLFGSLQKTPDSDSKSVIDFDLKTPTPLPQIIKDLRIVEDRVQLVMINHRAAPKDSIIHPGDRLALFPSEYPIFADWKNLRFI